MSRNLDPIASMLLFTEVSGGCMSGSLGESALTQRHDIISEY